MDDQHRAPATPQTPGGLPPAQPYPVAQQPYPPIQTYPPMQAYPSTWGAGVHGAAGPHGNPHGVPPSRGTNGLAIASLVLGVMGGVLLAWIFGIVALVQIKRRGQEGRGLAIAGIVLGTCWVLLFGVVVAFALASGPTRDTAGAVTQGGRESVTDLKAGDCVNGVHESARIVSLPVVPCAGPHQGEVFGVFELPAGAWPGDDVVIQRAEEGCQQQLESYAPTAAEDPQTEWYSLRPMARNWWTDRMVTCIATNTAGPQSGSLRD